jgi:sarcosine oxidase subunit beta
MKVVVIGGGVIGASVAYHLASRGVTDVVILDSAPSPGEGSTGKATGGYRAQFGTPINVQLSLLAREKILSLESETGVSPGYEPVGYLWIAGSDNELIGLRAGVAVQRSAGLEESREVSAKEIAELNPCVSLDGVIGGTFCPTDGYIRPLKILEAYLTAAQARGVKVEWNSPCVGLELTGGRARSVKTRKGSHDADVVVNAAGPWASRIARLAGVDLPVLPLRRQAAITEPTDSIPGSMPMTIYLDNGFHLRARDGRALLCWPTDGDSTDPFSTDVDDEWLSTVESMMRSRVPALRDAQLDRTLCYGGLYEMSPDKHPIVGFATECDNMFLVNGSSGHGVMHSPALGDIASAMILGEDPPIDVHCLRPSRFGEKDPIVTNDLL